MKLLTVATSDNRPAAHIAKGRLEVEGLACRLKHETPGQTDWLYTIAAVRYWRISSKLQTEVVNAARARQILATNYSDHLPCEGD